MRVFPLMHKPFVNTSDRDLQVSAFWNVVNWKKAWCCGFFRMCIWSLISWNDHVSL